MFIEKCDRCETEYIRKNAVTTVGLKKTGRVCVKKGVRGNCRCSSLFCLKDLTTPKNLHQLSFRWRKIFNKLLKPFTSLHQYARSPVFSIHKLWTYKENFHNNQECLEFLIISFILITLMFDSRVILLGEIRCFSLLEVKGLKHLLQAKAK